MDSVPTPLQDPTAPSPPPELRPYAPSWLDHLIRAIERLPIPNGLIYLAVFIAGHGVLGRMVGLGGP